MSLLVATGEVWTNPIIVGLAVGIPTTVLGTLTFRRTQKIDQVAAQSIVLVAQKDTMQQVLDGLNDIIDELRTDKAGLRQDIANLEERLSSCRRTLQEHLRHVPDDPR